MANGEATAWPIWALQLGTGRVAVRAPDGSEWYVPTRIEYV
jgi:hypothetical protein